jgi:hypothetical protein
MGLTVTKDENKDESVDHVTRADETPVERAQRLGQGADVDPGVPTGQTPEDIARSTPASNSNEELRIAGAKRAAGDRASGFDERGQVQR